MSSQVLSVKTLTEDLFKNKMSPIKPNHKQVIRLHSKPKFDLNIFEVPDFKVTTHQTMSEQMSSLTILPLSSVIG